MIFTDEMPINEMNKMINDIGGVYSLGEEISTEDLYMYINRAKQEFGYDDFDFSDSNKVGQVCFQIASLLQGRSTGKCLNQNDLYD